MGKMLERWWYKIDMLLTTGAATFFVWGPHLTLVLQVILGIGGLFYLACRFWVLGIVYNKVRSSPHLRVDDLKEGG